MTANSLPGSLDDADDIWGSNDEATTREWSKMDEDFTNAGYREGITAGKESALQEGFDDGFDTVGAPLGREIGILRGISSAAMSLFSSTEPRWKKPPEDPERCKEELSNINRDLGRINLADLAPQDIQAEEHAREHMEGDTTEKTHVPPDQDIDEIQAVEHGRTFLHSERPAPRPAVEELRRLRMRLSDVLKEFGLDITLE